jgi:protease I
MSGELNGTRVAVLATDGVEQVELDQPWQALVDAGAEPRLVSLEAGTVTAFEHIDKGGTRTVGVALAEADVVRGRRMTSWPSLRTDLRNAGAEWVDEQVVVAGDLTTSRNPDDLAAFGKAIVEQFAAG